jgi:F0F1-type ATP synthase epsilon subunit
VTTLKPGTLTWRREGGESKTVRIGGGLLEVINNRVTILTESVAEPRTEAR